MSPLWFVSAFGRFLRIHTLLFWARWNYSVNAPSMLLKFCWLTAVRQPAWHAGISNGLLKLSPTLAAVLFVSSADRYKESEIVFLICLFPVKTFCCSTVRHPKLKKHPASCIKFRNFAFHGDMKMLIIISILSCSRFDVNVDVCLAARANSNLDLSNKVVFYSEVLNFPSCLRRRAAPTWVIPPRKWSFIMSILFRLREGCNMKHLDMQITNYGVDIKWGSSAYETSHPASLNCVSHALNRLLCLLNNIHSSGWRMLTSAVNTDMRTHPVLHL